MSTAVLVISLITGGFSVANNVANEIKVLRAIHHHTTRPLYRHVLKPASKPARKAIHVATR